MEGKVFVKELKLKYKSTHREPFTVNGPEDVFHFLRPILKDEVQEHFVVLHMDASHKVISYEVITSGLVDTAPVHPREVFRGAFMQNAVAIIVAHNHPSGEVEPSQQDLEITRRLIDVGGLLGIPVLDHVIIGERQFCSLRELTAAIVIGQQQQRPAESDLN